MASYDYPYKQLKEGERWYVVAKKPAIFWGRTYEPGAAVRTVNLRVRSWSDDYRAFCWKENHLGPRNEAWIVTNVPSIYRGEA